MTAYHEPVMAAEVLAFLRPRDGALILDGTLGGGGHTRLVLEACPGCRVIAVDRDKIERYLVTYPVWMGELVWSNLRSRS